MFKKSLIAFGNTPLPDDSGSHPACAITLRAISQARAVRLDQLHRDNKYRVVPAHRNWQIETAAWIWPSFFHCALETRWLGVRKTCGIGLFYRNYRPLLQETGWLVSDFISVCLETRWLGEKKWFLCPGTLL